MFRALAASLLATASLALAPAAALAQNAPGDQYKDPLDNGGQTPPPSRTSAPPSSGTATGGGTTPGATASAAGSTVGTTGAAGSNGEANGREIPRTGFPVGLLMFAGALLLSGGLGLRRAAGSPGA